MSDKQAIDIPILDGEEWWASQAIDNTDSVIRSLLELTKSCIEHAELSLHNTTNNIELETNKWLLFCASLSGSAVAEMANAVEDKLNIFVAKHLKSRG